MKSQTKKLELSSLISSKSALDSQISQLNLWQIAVTAIAKSQWWYLCLIAVGSLSSIIYPHPP